MPELPEVEVTCRGVAPFVISKKIKDIDIREKKLRRPISNNIAKKLKGQTLKSLTRRGKYLIFEFEQGFLLLHLGMSGSLRVQKERMKPQKHDHVDMYFSNGVTLRFTDPRRFGLLIFTPNDPNKHELLSKIGPEPLESEFNGDYLYKRSRKRKVAVKIFIMNSHIVAGIGNVYATEALFLAGIKPQRHASSLTKKECEALAKAVKETLKKAVREGGTTLRNFVDSGGNPGNFSVSIKVYGRGGKPCYTCGTVLKSLRLGQRGTVYCPRCQH